MFFKKYVMFPKISIVTPSYNQGQFLEDTILSVLGQFYPNLEYIIYDGGSTDNSVDILIKYKNHLNYWESNKDKGQSEAINKGFARSTGDILMWLNSDDILMPNTLHYIAKQYLENGDGIYFGNCIHFEELSSSEVLSFGSNVIKNEKFATLELVDFIIQPSSFWSKKVWIENGMLNENFHFGFDWEWFLRAKKNKIPFHLVSKPLSIYRIHENHKTGTGGSIRQAELLNIYKLYSPFYFKLYELMINEKMFSSFLEKIIKAYYLLFFKMNFSKGHYLKLVKPIKYKVYSVYEINATRSML